MEQIKVNMIPNGEVKTIHCSKGDGKTRKWGFELFKEDGVIDASSISPQMFFDSYKGGTEQIIPENTSVPTTSPIIADIQYPDAMRSDQEFLYRECPTAEDGQAKITKIKGNTLVWNQLVKNGNFVDTSNWVAQTGASFSVSNNIASVLVSSQYIGIIQEINIISGHKFYICADAQSNTKTANIRSANADINDITTTTNWQHFAYIRTVNSNTLDIRLRDYAGSNFVTQYFKNVMVVDLTALGIDSLTTASEVEAWLSSHIGNLPYFAYNLGSLLSFNGTGLKTVGKNLLPLTLAELITLNSAGTWNGNVYNRNGVDFTVISNEEGYVTQIVANGLASGNGDFTLKSYQFKTGDILSGTSGGGINTYGVALAGVGIVQTDSEYTIPKEYSGSRIIYIRVCNTYNAQNVSFYPMVRLSNVQDDTFVPYTTNTLSLPISTYFPTGMKRAGNIFDELTENKAYTRVGSVDLGNVGTWSLGGGGAFFDTAEVSNVKALTQNLVSSKYVTGGQDYFINNPTVVGFSVSGTSKVRFYNSGASTSAEVITMLQGVTLNYELDTPTETTINTASLVSEQAEIPLYEDDDILIGECTTQLSSKSGFIPTKIKYQDDTGVAYSQKINLHVEK